LFRKNWITWKRTPWLSPFELAAPILLMLVLVYLRQSVSLEYLPATEFSEISIAPDGSIDYTTLMHFPYREQLGKNMVEEEKWMREEYGFAGVIPRPRLHFLPKACFWTGDVFSQKQYIGLAPRNEFTEAIAD